MTSHIIAKMDIFYGLTSSLSLKSKILRRHYFITEGIGYNLTNNSERILTTRSKIISKYCDDNNINTGKL